MKKEIGTSEAGREAKLAIYLSQTDDLEEERGSWRQNNTTRNLMVVHWLSVKVTMVERFDQFTMVTVITT